MLKGLALALLMPLPALAGTYGAVPPDEVAQLDVLPGWRDGATHVAAIRIRLAPGWKTYWRAPGDAGIPPEFRWRGSENLAGVALEWPTPEVFMQNGMRSIGYTGQLVLPVIVTPGAPGQPVRLKGRIDLGLCDEVCLPYTLPFDATLPAAGTPDPTIRAALAARARTAAEAGVTGAICAVDPIPDGLRVTATLSLPPQGQGEVVVIEPGSEGVWASEAQARRSGGSLTASADLVPPDGRPFPLDRSKLRITVISPAGAVDIRGCKGG